MTTKDRHAGEAAQRDTRSLSTRNRELACLYAVAEGLQAHGASADVLRRAALHLKKALPDRDAYAVRIVLDGETLATDPVEGPARWRAPIQVAGHARGAVEVCPLGGGPESADGSAGELVATVARQVAAAIERRDAEAQLMQAAKLASIGELAAGVSHEITNPVNGIINCADLLLQRLPEDSEDRAFAAMIRSEAERIANTVRGLLRFARRDIARHTRARPRALVESVAALTRKTLERSAVVLDIEVPEKLPELMCHREELEQVLVNLLINAVHALDERYPAADPHKRVAVRARAGRVGARGIVRLEVADTGAGIAPEHLPRLFDPFFTTKGRDKGTGLGLAVSAGIVEAHGGAFSVESRPGQGACFRVDLPVDHDWKLDGPAGAAVVWED